MSFLKIENFQLKTFDIFLNFAQNIDCGGGSNEYQQSTKQCFGAKIRKIGIPLHSPVLLYKSGVQGGIHGHVFVMCYQMHECGAGLIGRIPAGT